MYSVLQVRHVRCSDTVDVHYLVTMDHVYAGKHEIHLDKQVEEDSHSQDLFLSDDELRRVSHGTHNLIQTI